MPPPSGPGLPGRSTRTRALVAAVLLVAVTSVAACAPPPGARVHVGPLPTRLRSWEMGRDLPIYPDITEPLLAKGGAGWDPQSAALTEGGTIVLFAHRVSRGGPFRTLDLLQPGNVISISGSDGRTYNYSVVKTRVTAPNWNDVLAWQPSNGRGLTLVACHPPGSIRYRIVVHAELMGT